MEEEQEEEEQEKRVVVIRKALIFGRTGGLQLLLGVSPGRSRTCMVALVCGGLVLLNFGDGGVTGMSGPP